jgi:hypothetical protein
MGKDATIKIELKADSGYKSGISGRITPFQWRMINRALEQKQDYEFFSHQYMIDFGAFCLVKNQNKQNGTVEDFLKEFIKEKFE